MLRHPQSLLLAFLPLGVLLSLVGCGEAVPELETWPVTGKVVDQRGEVVSSGAVRCMTNSDSHLITTGILAPDGSFNLRTQRKGFKYDGAVAGTYSVVVYFEGIGANGDAYPAQFELPVPFTVQSEDNLLEITIKR